MTSSYPFVTAPPDIDLSIIVPVYNAKEHLQPLVDSILSLDNVRCEILLADDGSSDGSSEEVERLAAVNPEVRALHNPGNLGAGHARNLAWPHARGRYTIFFDADDRLHGEVIAPVLAQMDAEPDIDTAMLGYRYQRDESGGFTDMLYGDQKMAEGYLKGASQVVAPLTEMATLLKFTNYPWNKIVRTAHFREVGLRFGRTKVNNDILGHWSSLLFARRVLFGSQVICTHIVYPHGQNLTNRFNVDRLQMFDALSETYDLLLANPVLRRRFAHHFWGFCITLANWGRRRVDAEHQLEFERRYRDLIGRIEIEDFTQMRLKLAPQIADRFVKDLLG
jgi:glycosyltransferase involved in cell wall biosynthesis